MEKRMCLHVTYAQRLSFYTRAHTHTHTFIHILFHYTAILANKYFRDVRIKKCASMENWKTI